LNFEIRKSKRELEYTKKSANNDLIVQPKETSSSQLLINSRNRNFDIYGISSGSTLRNNVNPNLATSTGFNSSSAMGRGITSIQRTGTTTMGQPSLANDDEYEDNHNQEFEPQFQQNTKTSSFIKPTTLPV
jgi:hypothetical protein